MYNIKPANVEIIKQNRTVDDKVKTSTPNTSNSFCMSDMVSGKGQLSSQSMQLQAVVLFYNNKFIKLLLITYYSHNLILLTSIGRLHGVTGPLNCSKSLPAFMDEM